MGHGARVRRWSTGTDRVGGTMIRRVEGVDAAFLAGETEEWHFHVAALQVLDPMGREGFGFDAFRELCARRVHRIPQFRWKLHQPPLGWGWSYFAEDPAFSVDHHLHRIAVPAPGGRAELDRLVGDLIGRRIDRSRPLWEMWFIEGLAAGRAAVLTKVHHSIIDGQSGVGVAAALADLTPDPEPDPEPPPFEPGPALSLLEVVARNGVRAAAVPWRVARLGRELVEQAVAALPFARAESPPVLPFQAPRSRFNGQLSPHRSFASVSLPLATVKQVKDAAGVKVNDVVMAVCAGALRAHLDASDDLPAKPLIAQVPTSTRADAADATIGTKVGSMFVSLATDLADPAARLAAIAASAAAAKRLRGALAGHRSLGMSDAIPPTLFGAAARAWGFAHLDARTPPAYNVIISNVAGPPVPFYSAGARVEAMYPLGPLLYGGGLNITVFSYHERIDVGVQTCSELVPEPWVIAERFGPALDELADAVLDRSRPESVPDAASGR